MITFEMNLTLPQPYLLFVGDVTDERYAKTAFGLRDWSRDRCVGPALGLPDYCCARVPN